MHTPGTAPTRDVRTGYVSGNVIESDKENVVDEVTRPCGNMTVFELVPEIT
jgi:hypothetical protein